MIAKFKDFIWNNIQIILSAPQLKSLMVTFKKTNNRIFRPSVGLT